MPGQAVQVDVKFIAPLTAGAGPEVWAGWIVKLAPRVSQLDKYLGFCILWAA
jgi:hypothetical protein